MSMYAAFASTLSLRCAGTHEWRGRMDAQERPRCAREGTHVVRALAMPAHFTFIPGAAP